MTNKLEKLKELIQVQYDQGIEDSRKYLFNADAGLFDRQTDQNQVYRWVLRRIAEIEMEG